MTTSAGRAAIPPGTPSTIRGRWQRPALQLATAVAGVAAAVSLVLPRRLGVSLAAAAAGVIVASPVLRVGWLCYRWAQERDWPFVAAGLVLLAIIAGGAVAAL